MKYLHDRNSSHQDRTKVMYRAIAQAISLCRLHPWLVVLIVLLVIAQAVYGMKVSPARKEGVLYIDTVPRGAQVIFKESGGAEGRVPVGVAPGPINVSQSQLPRNFEFILPLYQTRSKRFQKDELFDRITGKPLPYSIPLVPAIPVLSPAVYSVRDYFFLYGALVAFIVFIVKAAVMLKKERDEEAISLRLEFGDFSEGVPVGPYRLGKLAGTGGMARVFRATRKDEPDGEVVALKILSGSCREDSEFFKRFSREVNILRDLVHPNIVPLLDWGEASGYLYLVMEYIDGDTLQSRAAKGEIPLDMVMHYASQVAEALCYAHEKGIVHRDVKPGNIMITGINKAMLMDFGIARRKDLPVYTQAGQGLGTPAYASPEQINGKSIDWRSDYYSLGILLYEILAGRHPFGEVTALELIRRHIEDTPEPLETCCHDIPTEIITLINSMIAKNPLERAHRKGDIPAMLKAIAEKLRTPGEY
ncbi:MAG: serine/threonine protein kinase [Vulcanimicrobiota bacterium]